MRRAQLVTPFGVGAMSVLVNGTSVITAGLDHWYEPDDASSLALEEYQEHDWRLEARLRVSEFRLPPDYRYQGQGNDNRNVKLTVPVDTATAPTSGGMAGGGGAPPAGGPGGTPPSPPS